MPPLHQSLARSAKAYFKFVPLFLPSFVLLINTGSKDICLDSSRRCPPFQNLPLASGRLPRGPLADLGQPGTRVPQSAPSWSWSSAGRGGRGRCGSCGEPSTATLRRAQRGGPGWGFPDPWRKVGGSPGLRSGCLTDPRVPSGRLVPMAK